METTIKTNITANCKFIGFIKPEREYIMRTKTINNAKLIVTIKSKKKENKIEIVSVFDNRENNFWSNDRMLERGINNFLNLDDMKETLNWNLNGDSSKYQFKWGQSTRLESEGRAYIFD